jgi:diadenosine tetraphosphatase ApaH/serine/threonine PP2A family protein phosphatase
MVLVDSPPQRWAEVLTGVDAPTVACGHTHMPFDRLAGGQRVLNPGSVGMPYGHPGAAWALLGPSVALRRTAYDAEAAARIIMAGSYPDALEWVREYVLNHYSDTEALEAFSQIAREQAG